MTTWTERDEVQTTWEGRIKTIFYVSPLEGVNGIVHDEDDEIIYIYADSGKEIPATNWTPRPVLND